MGVSLDLSRLCPGDMDHRSCIPDCRYGDWRSATQRLHRRSRRRSPGSLKRSRSGRSYDPHGIYGPSHSRVWFDGLRDTVFCISRRDVERSCGKFERAEACLNFREAARGYTRCANVPVASFGLADFSRPAWSLPPSDLGACAHGNHFPAETRES